MDIWSWVADTVRSVLKEHPRLAWMLYRFAGFVVNNQHEQVEALYPEAMALAAQVRQPWLEVFFRHWLLQSRILRRSMVRESLPDAIDLLERSHREDTRDCPQTVCVAQDLCVAYGRADGPGYAQERLKVCEETLSQITPAWPCWRCITGEYADALNDMGRFEEALRFMDEQVLAIQQAGKNETRDSLRGAIVQALLALGRLEEALAFNSEAKHEGGGDGYVLSKNIDQARILARMGRFEQALEVLPAWEEVEGTCADYADWCEGLYRLVEADAWESAEPAASYLIRAYKQLALQGVVRDALRLALWAGRLLLRVGHLLIARQVGEDAEAMLPELAALLGADHEVSAFLAEVQQRQAEEQPCGEAERAALLADATRGEKIASERLARVYASFPEDWSLLDAMCTIWERFHLFARAREALEAYQQKHPADPRGVLALAHRTFENADESAFLSLCQRYSESSENEVVSGLAWYRARFAERKGEKPLAIRALRESLEKHWRADSALWLVGLLREEDQLEEALAVLEAWQAREERAAGSKESEVSEYTEGSEKAATIDGTDPSESTEGSEEADWERMLVGTRLERWDVVREAAERLGFDVPAEIGLVWGEVGLCRVLFPEEGHTYVAMRIGPVTASIVEMAMLGDPQHFEDIVTFVMPPLNLGALREEDENPTGGVIPLFRADAVVKRAGYRVFEIEGVHPGEAAIAELRERLGTLGVAFQQRSDEQFTLHLQNQPDHADDQTDDNSEEDEATGQTDDDSEEDEATGQIDDDSEEDEATGQIDDDSEEDEATGQTDDNNEEDEATGQTDDNEEGEATGQTDDDNEEDAQEIMGIYAYLAIPPSCSLDAVDALLIDWAETSRAEIGWLSLLRALEEGIIEEGVVEEGIVEEGVVEQDKKKSLLSQRFSEQQILLGRYGL